MVLQGRPCGRVGRCRGFFQNGPHLTMRAIRFFGDRRRAGARASRWATAVEVSGRVGTMTSAWSRTRTRSRGARARRPDAAMARGREPLPRDHVSWISRRRPPAYRVGVEVGVRRPRPASGVRRRRRVSRSASSVGVGIGVQRRHRRRRRRPASASASSVGIGGGVRLPCWVGARPRADPAHALQGGRGGQPALLRRRRQWRAGRVSSRRVARARRSGGSARWRARRHRRARRCARGTS